MLTYAKSLISAFNVKKKVQISFSATTLLYVLPLILIVPALLWHLDLMPTLGDEAIRALVALEFLHKGDYITPTLNGELYFKKPPFFNWVLLLFFNWGGKATEFFIRLPAVCSLLLYSLIIYITQRNSLGSKLAFVSAFAFITFGRMLFYDSMLGHIDLLFSLTVYSALILVWYFYKKENNYALFILSYLLIAISFLMKGFPAIVFLGCTFVGLIIYDKSIKRFLTLSHILGVLTFAAVIGLYFYIYSLRNDTKDFVHTLWEESSKRTVLENNWLTSLQFFFTFPFEYFFQLMPWTLLLITCFRKDFIQVIKGNSWVLFSFIVLCSNILVYWLSPETRPRYLFPLIPFLFHILIYFYSTPGADKQKKITEVLLTITFFIFAIASILPFVVDMPNVVANKEILVVCFFLSFVLLTYLSFKFKSYKLLLLISLLVIARLEFDAFVLPVRAVESPEVTDRATLLAAISKLDDSPIWMDKNIDTKICVTYYITREKKQIVKRYVGDEVPNANCLIEDYRVDLQKHIVVADFVTDRRHFYFVKRK